MRFRRNENVNRRDAEDAESGIETKMVSKKSKSKRLLCVGLCVLCVSAVHLFAVTDADAPLGKPLFSQSFEQLPEGDPPGEIVVLSGAFAVKNVDGNKVLEVPGDPVDGYGVLFGPEVQAGVSVSGRIFASATGKRMPEFGVGLGDTNGYKLWVMPATNQVQIMKGEDVKATSPFTWKSGAWTSLKLEVRKAGEGKYVVEGKAWMQGGEEPKEWMVKWDEREEPPKGKASAWGSPYSSTPIRFDDLVVAEVKE
jgi:hypothetical protein